MTWIKDVVLISAILGFVQWILPSGTFEKYIKFIFSLIMLSAILTPLMKEHSIPANLELPQGAVASERTESWSNDNTDFVTYQEIQIREILKKRIQREIYLTLNDEFPGISEEDIEVYIEQRSLEEGYDQCLITIQTKENQSREIRNLLEQRLDLNGVRLSIVQKKVKEIDS